ncbi:MAG: ABC transporter ATP-binding protein [Alphaproteobacteria bacterium]|nr:ABC transporter ATP-binding protein [Alphaproteobacteria bacterium]
MGLADNKAAIAAQNVSKVFRGAGQEAVAALDNVSLTINQNEFFTLLGPSGCGKTTLLRLIAGFEFPTDGHIYLYGEDIALLPAYKRPVNTVFQNYALFPHMTVAQNIAFGLEMLGKPKAEIDARVLAMLKLVRMEELSGRKTSQISGGQQQRVALARALAPKPKVLLLDEPLSALDYKLRKEMQIELKRLQTETGITFIFVTHDQEEALTMSDRIAVMSKGKVLQVGTPHEIYDHPAERFVANFIGETNFLKGEIVSSAKGVPRVKLEAGPTISADAPRGGQPAGKVTVVLRPEQATLVPAGKGELQGVVDNVVFFGTDTHFHVRLADGSMFMTRQQNSGANAGGPKAGDKAGIQLAANAARILKD